MELNNPVLKLTVIVAALFALLFVAIQLSKHPISDKNTPQDESQKNYQINNVEKSKLPNKFPSDLPQEVGAVVTQNFNATGQDGTYNATREFESSKTLAQNITTYTKYLKDNDWEIKATIDQSTIKMVMGKKENQTLQIVAAVNPTKEVNVITITLTEQPQPATK